MIKQRFYSIQRRFLIVTIAIILLISCILTTFFIQNQKAFLLNLRIPSEQISLYIHGFQQKVVFLVGIIVFCSIWILYFVTKIVLKPISKLSLATRTVASGDLDYPITIDTDDEIAEIAKDFTVIERSLKATIRNLEKRNKELNLLSQLSTRMTTALNTEEVIRQVLEGLTRDLEYEYVLISTLSDDGKETINHIFSGELHIKKAIEDIIEEDIFKVRAPVAQMPFLKEISSGKIIVKEKLSDFLGRLYPESVCEAIQVLLGAKYIICLALLVKRIATCFLLIFTSKESVTDDDIKILKAFAHSAGLALENAKLYEEKSRWAEKLEEEVAQRTKELEDAMAELAHREKMAALGIMASRMGHELRNPLAIIRSNLFLLERKVPDEYKRYLEMIGRAEERANIVIEETMGFVKGVAVKKEPVNINDVIEESTKSISHELVKVEVKKELAKDMPLIALDSHWIQNLFTNILINAIQAMEGEGVFHPPGEKIGKIEIRSAVFDSHIEVSIADSGPGIDPKIRNKVFEPFFGTKTRGTGLGLAICKEIAEKHKGIIEIGDRKGGGALFTIKLPR
jgi:signal transduction histidine kinase/HAMP domain-containing protein